MVRRQLSGAVAGKIDPMSLVITAFSPEVTVQVSETRLSSLRDRSPLCDDQRKSILVLGKEARFVVGWVGLARGPGHDTGLWLAESLCAVDAAQVPVDQVVRELTGLATKHFKQVPMSAEEKRCHFVLAGWRNVAGEATPFACVIYNDLTFHEVAEDREQQVFTRATVTAPEFMHCMSSLASVKSPFLVTVVGDFDAKALKAHFRGLRGLLKKGAEAKAISAACRQIVLEGARQRPNTVGSTVLSVEMDRNGSAWCSYYNEHGQEEMLVPDLLTMKGLILNPSWQANIEGDQVNIRLRGQVARRYK